MTDPDRMYLDFKGARERLCRAQTFVVPAHKDELQTALDIIDRMGLFYAPAQWSEFDEPPPPYGEPERPRARSRRQRPEGLHVPDGHKWCPRCGQVQPLDNFAKNRAAKDGKQVYCRPCGAAQVRESARRRKAG